MRIKSTTMGIIVVIIIFGGILTTMGFNIWYTESTKIPAQFTNGEYKGQYNPSDIRGSYSFQDINNSFDVPIDVLGKAFNITDTDNLAFFQAKQLEEIYTSLAEQGQEIGTGSVRLFVALYLGLPFDLEEDTYLPEQAVEILKARGMLSEEQLEFIIAHSVNLSEVGQNSTNTVLDEHTEDEKSVKGKTTFAEIMDWGLSKETIEDIIGEKMPAAPGMTIRDFCQQKGLTFSTIKEQLQNVLDQ